MLKKYKEDKDELRQGSCFQRLGSKRKVKASMKVIVIEGENNVNDLKETHNSLRFSKERKKKSEQAFMTK